ncbi:hypothetical protein B0H13DRAFT_2539766 [Mycena leptocephala]|nr:hypothetical protein B0H13DRAFT_2539766 [Mycena leptocephala]
MSGVDLEDGLSHQSRVAANGLWSKIVALATNVSWGSLQNTPELKATTAPESDISLEKEVPAPKYTEAESEAACAKLWAIYVGEAEKYDKRLVESWKGDMDGLLIFSGLFSASLTAFLVESYTTLQPDPGVTSAALLAQISRQLAGNGTDIPFQEPVPFRPTTAALSNGPGNSFTGLNCFGMYAVVDLIPLLLHASLIIFFTGLVFFLLPVNPLLMHLMSFVLAAFLVVYTTLTALPVIFLESPYQTPLSKGVWQFWQFSAALMTNKLSKTSRPASGTHPRLTITQAMERRSQENPKFRDQHAVQWTVAALTDDFELIPFVEAIPDIVHGAKGFHRANDYLLHPLLYTQEPTLQSGHAWLISSLLGRLYGHWRNLRRTDHVCRSPITFYFDRETFKALEDSSLDSYYTISVRAAVRHKLLADLKAHCQHVLACLDGWETASVSSRSNSLQLIQSALHTTLKEGEFYAVHLDMESQDIFRALQTAYALHVDPSHDARAEPRRAIRHLQTFMNFTSDLCRELPAHATPRSDIHSFVLALVQWAVINALSDEIAQEDAAAATSPEDSDAAYVQAVTVAVSFRARPLLVAFFPNNVEDADPEWPLSKIYSDLANQITEISLILFTAFLRAYLANRGLFSAGRVLILCLERQCRTNFEGMVSAEAQRSFASGILSLVKRLEDDIMNPELEEVVKNAWSASYYWSWMNDSDCASILLESLTLCDTLGWTNKNPDSQSYIHSLRLRCFKLVV